MPRITSPLPQELAVHGTLRMHDSAEGRYDFYCMGCNERFAAAAPETNCPRCGVAAESAVTICSETLLLHEDQLNASVDTLCEQRRDDSRDESLVGRNIHVYRCDSLLGRGGMGRVYLARHLALHRRCALKLLAPRLAEQDQDYVERFQQEGRAAAELVHPNIVTIHAIGEADGRHFLEMEFVSGPSLQQMLRQDGPQTPIRATALAAQIAFGLAFAHRAGIVHRDLKPDNVMLTARGVPKIADFGLAKRIVAEAPTAQPHQLVGTPNFMAPELFRGAEATPASDIYALGVCYYLLLTGRYPFVGRNITDLMRVVSTDDVPDVRRQNPEIPLEMAECLNMMLSKSAGNRPADGMAAWSLLQAVLGQARDIESLLVEAFSDDPRVRWTRQDRRFTVELALDQNRRQKVFVETSDHRAQDRLLHIYSVCCRAEETYYEEALRLNSEIPHGSIGIRTIDGEAKFVMVDTYPRATVDTEELRRSVLEVATRADTIEEQLTGQDLH